MDAEIIIELAPKMPLHRRRSPWIFNYKECNLFGFGGWSSRGGITKAKIFAKQLKLRMKTNPVITVKNGFRFGGMDNKGIVWIK